MNQLIRVGSRSIGLGHPVFVIAEIGANFFNTEEAFAMIDAAVEAGADAIKVQTFRAETLSAPGAMFTFEDGSRVSQREYWKAREIGEQLHRELKEYTERHGLIFFSTPSFDEDVDLLERVGVLLHKIGSDDLTNAPFLKRVAARGRPVILSTGMCTLDEIAESVRAIETTGNEQLILLHCLVGYPAPAEDANLKAIETLQRAFGYLVGFSDHTLSSMAACLAVSLGAVVVERHLTLDRARGGPDDLVASDPAGFKQYVRDVRKVPTLLGDGVKRIMPGEVKWREAGRKSIVAACRIKAGDTITEEKITIKRPASGLHPKFLSQVIGATAKRDLQENDLVSLSDLEWR